MACDMLVTSQATRRHFGRENKKEHQMSELWAIFNPSWEGTREVNVVSPERGVRVPGGSQECNIVMLRQTASDSLANNSPHSRSVQRTDNVLMYVPSRKWFSGLVMSSRKARETDGVSISLVRCCVWVCRFSPPLIPPGHLTRAWLQERPPQLQQSLSGLGTRTSVLGFIPGNTWFDRKLALLY